MVSYFAPKPPKTPSAYHMQMQLDKQPLKEGSHTCFILQWEWTEKGTIRLTRHEQMPGDAGGGLVGLGSRSGLYPVVVPRACHLKPRGYFFRVFL